MKKYELTGETKLAYGKELFRIKALVDFGEVKCGDIGGWIEKEHNLSHEGNAWVYGDAEVYGYARVYGNAEVYGYARVCGNAEVYGYARVCGNAEVYGYARVYGNAEVYGHAEVCGCARVYGHAEVCGCASVYGHAEVYGNARVYGDAGVYGHAEVCGAAEVCGNARVCEDADYAAAKGFGSCFRTTTFFRCKDRKVKVACGCFYGTIPEFREKVKETHKDSKIAKEYLMIADLMDMHFDEGKQVTE